MTQKNENPFSTLEKIFHEPNRLSIMSVLCGEWEGIAFNDLKDQCNLTDGNLSRHLKTLEESEMVRIEKKFVGVKPRTTVFITQNGYDRFLEYLNNLEEVLKTAAKAAAVREKTARKFRAPGFVKRPAET